jgi:AbrB family looped-hinge helix DNA binding protein
MSTQELPPNGQADVYNNDGMTVIPKDVRDDLGIEPGDRLEFVSEDGYIKAYKIEDK